MTPTDTIDTTDTHDAPLTASDDAFVKEFGAKLDAGTTTPEKAKEKVADTKAEPPRKEPVKKAEQADTIPDEDALDDETPDATAAEQSDDSDSADDADDLDESADNDSSSVQPDTGTDTVPEAVATKAFTDALEEQGVSTSLDDIPAEYRPVVEKKMKDLVAGFTNARKADREQFRDTIALRAEMRLLSERPADVIVEKILKNPALAEQINAKLDTLDKMDQLDGKAGSSAIAHQESVKRAREAAVTTEQSEATRADTEARRVDAITSAGRRAAKAAGVPFEAGVEDAIAAQLALGHLDITLAEITTIAQQKAAVWERSTRAVRREAQKGYVKRKVADRTKAALQIKPNSGGIVSPGRENGPTTDDEFVAHMRAKL